VPVEEPSTASIADIAPKKLVADKKCGGAGRLEGALADGSRNRRLASVVMDRHKAA